MGTKAVSLPAALEQYIDAKVASGEYADASDVVRESLSLMMQEEAEKLEWLRNAIAEGIASADAGPLLTSEEMLESVKRRGAERLARERRNAV
jgi:antitoxin ParD1/3/4